MQYVLVFNHSCVIRSETIRLKKDGELQSSKVGQESNKNSSLNPKQICS